MYIFFTAFLAVIVGLHIFCAATFQFFFPSQFTKILMWALPLAGTALMLAAFALQRHGGNHGAPFMLAGYYWIGILFIFFSVCFVMVAGAVALGWLKTAVPHWLGPAGIIIMFLFSVMAIIGGQRTPVVEKINIKAANMPVEKLTVAQISDTHLGAGVSIGRVKKMVETINALNPDLILVTGDLFEGGGNGLRQQNIDVLKNLKAKYGIYGSLGNHEFYSGLGRSIEFYEAAGVKLLRQQTVHPLPGVAVSGADDFTSARIRQKDFENFLNTLNPHDYNILMAHEPRYYASAKDKVNLMLSGHTHNGQIFPFNLLVRLRYRHSYGLFTDGGTNYYVTSGVFYWGPPMRLFTQNEIAFITVEK